MRQQLALRWRAAARQLKREVYALNLAYRDPRTPMHARLFAALVVAYALSPLDLIPDPIPVLGYLDDLILVPLGVALALRMIPRDVMTECRQRASEEDRARLPVSRAGAVMIVVVWLAVAVMLVVAVSRHFRR